MKRNVFIVSAVLGALAICGTASAQSAGNFAGSSQDGSTISLTVAKSGSTYTVTAMSVGMQAACKKTGNSVNEGWAFFAGADISSGQANFTSQNDYYYTTGSMHFSGHNAINGVITSYTATFAPGSTPPTGSQFCKVDGQNFSLTKEAPGKVVEPVEQGRAVVLPKPDAR